MSHKHVWNDAWSSDIISMRVKRCVLLHMFLKVRSGLKDSLWLQRFEIISCLSKTVSTSFFSVLSDFKGKPFPFTYFVHTGSKILSEGVTVTSFKLIIFLKKHIQLLPNNSKICYRTVSYFLKTHLQLHLMLCKVGKTS